MAGNVAASQQGDVREGSRRGSSSDPAGSSSAQPGLAEAGGERGRLGLTEREREGVRERGREVGRGRRRGEDRSVRQQRPGVADLRYCNGEHENGGECGLAIGCGRYT